MSIYLWAPETMLSKSAWTPASIFFYYSTKLVAHMANLHSRCLSSPDTKQTKAFCFDISNTFNVLPFLENFKLE